MTPFLYLCKEKVLLQICFNFLSSCLVLTAGEAGWHLHLPALCPHCRQTHHLYSGGQEPQENGCGWIVRWAPLYIYLFIYLYIHICTVLSLNILFLINFFGAKRHLGVANCIVRRRKHVSTAIRSVLLCSRADAAVVTMQQPSRLLGSALAPSVGALKQCD